ncbi:hypothetical protein FS749_007007 [Ceratobasidium sp. UAMH 11750]|nr:hypothetical protein FS749_007007 [Ceratobasidium sp. UAMH 11750]
MPPKSKKRVKKAPEPNTGPDSAPESVENSASTSRIPAQSRLKGFLSLPHELLLKIANYFPKILPYDILLHETCVGHLTGAASGFQSRFNTLRALSQTCRFLREFYLPLLWERFEACLTSNTQASWYRDLGEAMERKSKGMLNSKHLWPYVQFVTVVFTRYKVASVLPPFVKLLQSLPNVHTLEVSHTHSAMTTALKEAFKGSSFPSIRTVIMPTCAHEVLRCCPGIRDVTCNYDDGQKLVSALIAAGCTKLEVLKYVKIGPTVLKRLIKANPPLRYVRVKKDKDDIRSFSSFPSLRTIEIEVFEEHPTKVAPLVQIAKEALQACVEYVPAVKGKKTQKSQAGQEDLVDLYTEPRMVKVRNLSRHSTGSGWGLFTIEEFPI